MCTVSVITTFLNAERFIHEAVESVFSQTYDDWELFLVDDGSNDGSTRIARRYARLHPNKVRYLEHSGHTNRGMSASRNLALSRAHGKFIALLDADDVWLPEKLDRQVRFLNQNRDVDLVFNRGFIWKDNVKAPKRMPLQPGRLQRGEWAITLLGCDGTDALTCAAMIRRDAVMKLGGWEDSVPRLFDDQVLWIKASLNSTVYYDDGECDSLYRIHPTSTCASTPAQEVQSQQIGFFKWVVAYLKQHSDPGFDSRLPTVMAQSNLAKALLNRMIVSNGSRPARLRQAINLIRTNNKWLGHLSAGILLVGTVSVQTANILAEGVFVMSRVTHTEGLRKSVPLIPRYVLLVMKAIVPQPIKLFIKQFLGLPKN